MKGSRKYVRKFGGKRFRRFVNFTEKSNAESRKRQLQQDGWLVRITKEKSRSSLHRKPVYVIWKRRK